MNCKYLTIRSKKYQKYYYCRLNKQIVKNCSNCIHKEYKEQKQLKNKTQKLQKIEKNRFSILQLNTNQCFICHTEKEKLDKHEAIGGMNRLASIKWGLILYLCRKCHSELDTNQEKKEKLQILAQDKFEELYGLDKFIQEFKMNYKEKYRR